MGLKNKLLGYAGEKIVGKILTGDTVNNVVNKAMEINDNKKGIKNIDYLLNNIQSKYCLVIKSRSYSLGTMFKGDKSRKTYDEMLGRYQIYDKNGILKYKSDVEISCIDRDILNLYDSDNKKIGYVKEWLLSVGDFLNFEKDVKKCTVNYNKKKICVLKKYKSMGCLYFDSLDGDADVEKSSDNEFVIKYKEKKIAVLHQLSLKLKDGYVEKYVLEYDNIKYETVAVLMAIAIDTVNC